MTLAQKYRKSKDERWCLRLKTVHPDGGSYAGVVTDIKRNFIVLHKECDFEFDGLVVLPKRVISGFRDGRFEKCQNEILRQNKAIRRVRSPRWLDSCATLPQVVGRLRRQHVWPGVEILFNNGTDSAFYLGPIIRLTDDTFFLRCYDATGEWEKEYEIEYSEVFRIEFDSKYCNYFNAYMTSRSGT